MTLYADNMRGYARVDRGSRVVTGRWSHLMADNPAELAAFAARLGLHPDWLQFPGTPNEHYDIVEAVRRRAVAAGAVPISYPRGTGNLVTTKRLQAAALDAASRGWHVFPLRPGSKIPAVRDWEHQASTDPERIRDLWAVRLQHGGWHVPEPPNLGIACGPSGLVVIDLDLAKPDQDRTGWPHQWSKATSGVDVLAAVAGQAGHTVPDTYEVATASGGRHLYFTAPSGTRIRNTAGRPGPMIDIRGEGGYVVAAGSHLHPRPGRDHSAAEPSVLVYRLVQDRQPAELPGWLTGAIAADRDSNSAAERPQLQDSRDQDPDSRSQAYGAAALREEADRVRSAPVGQRNHTLNSAAYSLGQLVAAGALDQDRAVGALTAAAESAGLEAAETAATIDSGLTAGARRPRLIPVRSDPQQTGPVSPTAVRRPESHDTDPATHPARLSTEGPHPEHADGPDDAHGDRPQHTDAGLADTEQQQGVDQLTDAADQDAEPGRTNVVTVALNVPRLVALGAAPAQSEYVFDIDEFDRRYDATDDPQEQAALSMAAGHLCRRWTERYEAYADRFAAAAHAAAARHGVTVPVNVEVHTDPDHPDAGPDNTTYPGRAGHDTNPLARQLWWARFHAHPITEIDPLAIAFAAERHSGDNPAQAQGSRNHALDSRSDGHGAAALQSPAPGTTAATTAGDGCETGDGRETSEGRADDPAPPAMDSSPQGQSSVSEDQHDHGPRPIGAELMDPQQPPSDEFADTSANGIEDRDDSFHARRDSADRPAAGFTIDEHDAAIAGWLFGEAFSAWRDFRSPCYPADTLRLSCEHEGLPTEGKSDRRFSGQPHTYTFLPAPGEELLDRDVWDAMTQAQRDDWNHRRTEPPVAPSGAPRHPDGTDAVNAPERRPFDTAPAPARSGATDQAAGRPADSEEPAGARRTEPKITAVTRETAADALPEAARAVPKERSSGKEPVVAGETVDQSTEASVLEVWNEPPSDPSGQAEASKAPAEAPRQAKPLHARTRPAVVPEETLDAHAALDAAIEHARAAVAHLEASRAATRRRSGAEPPDAAIATGPAYWAEPEVDL